MNSWIGYNLKKLKTPFVDLINGKPVYIFHHLPKTGGRSLRIALANWFITVQDYAPPYNSPEYSRYERDKINLNRLKPYNCLIGHYNTKHQYLQHRYPQIFDNKTRYRVFSFVRDPFEMVVSNYYYRKKTGRKCEATLEKHLVKKQLYLASLLQCNSENYKTTIDQYFFIGILEKAQESLDILADLINRPKIKYPHINLSKRNSEFENLSKELIEAFKVENHLDFLIYEYCVQKLEAYTTTSP